MWKMALVLMGFIIVAALFWLASGGDFAIDLAHILLPAFGAVVVIGFAIGIAPLFDKTY